MTIRSTSRRDISSDIIEITPIAERITEHTRHCERHDYEKEDDTTVDPQPHYLQPVLGSQTRAFAGAAPASSKIELLPRAKLSRAMRLA